MLDEVAKSNLLLFTVELLFVIVLKNPTFLYTVQLLNIRDFG